MLSDLHVEIKPSNDRGIYKPEYISITRHGYTGCRAIDRGLAHYLGYSVHNDEEFEKAIKEIRADYEKYNSKLKKLWDVDGFKEYFSSKGYYVSEQDVTDKFGEEVADLAMSLYRPSNCFPYIVSYGEALLLEGTTYVADLEFNNRHYEIKINGSSEGYPKEIDDKYCLWNWNSNGTDYSVDFAVLISEKYHNLFDGGILESFDYYDQWRGEDGMTANKMMNIVFDELEKWGYLSRYRVLANNMHGVWNYYTSLDDNSVGLYLVDKKAFKDELLIARINALFEACSIEYDDDDNAQKGSLIDDSTDDVNFDEPFYYLQDSSNKTYISRNKGVYGGHNKLKIYGRLDCPSANRYVAKGEYFNHRVFFTNEETAISAGYRPCGVCMKEKYKEWKKIHPNSK